MRELWRSNPKAVLLALVFHLALLLLLIRNDNVQRTMDSASDIETAPQVSHQIEVSEALVRENLKQIKEKQRKRDDEIVGLRLKEDSQLQVLREQQEIEKEKLKAAEIERQKAEEEKKRQEAAAEKARQQAEAEKKLLAEEKKKAAETEKKRLAEEAKKAEAEKQRLAEEKKRDEVEKKRLAEEKKLIEDEEKRTAEKKKIEAEKRRLADAKRKADKKKIDDAAAAAATKKAAAARKEAATAAANQKRGGTGSGGSGRTSGGGGGTDYNKYIGPIRTKIRRNWSRPAGVEPGQSCVLQIKLFPGGGVADVRVLSSSGNEAFDQSAQSAVYKADPLPVPSGAAFDTFRTLKLKFKPDGIR